MRIAIYTSFAINYLAKARVLAATVRELNPDISIIAVVCDKFPQGIDPKSEPFNEVWMVDEYPCKSAQAWIFSHNIMELCTAVKGWALQRILADGYDFAIYLDPDCWVLEDPAQIIHILQEGMSVAVVPHTTSPARTSEEIRLIETSSLKHGIYNLGFLLVKNDKNGNLFANWWAERLHDYCLIDFDRGIFTDQRWVDLAVGYFPFMQVSRHKGIDVASWNVGQRKLERAGEGRYLVDGDPLVFYHFSGVGPTGVHRWVRDIFAPSDPLAAELEFRYESKLNDAGQKIFASVRPAYDLYHDGSLVTQAERVKYRDTPDAVSTFPDPYAALLTAPFRTRVTHTVKQTVSPESTASDAEIEAAAESMFDEKFFGAWMRMPDAEPDTLWRIYKARGWSGDVRPNRYFDTSYYKFLVGGKGRGEFATPLHHYVARGAPRLISPAWFFDETFYLKMYPEVAKAVRVGEFISGFHHFMLRGFDEGRISSGIFDEANYLKTNPDVAKAVSAGLMISGADHFMSSGYLEQRMGCNPNFLY
jgi:hypothetical protein